MAVSLMEIYNKLKASPGQEIELVAGEKGMGNTVTWVHIVEVNDLTSFLEGNELVFMTGINTKDEQQLMGLVEAIYKGGASGLVINTGMYIEKIPVALADFCNNRGFPLFEVPWKVYLGHTMKICNEEIYKSEQKNMEIASALTNAVYNHENQNLYVPILERHGFNQEWPYCIALAEFVPEKDINLSKLVERVAVGIEHSLVFYSVHVKVVVMGNQIALVFVNQSDGNVFEIMEHIKDRFRLKDSPVKVYIGVGRNTNSVRCLYKTYRIAHKVVELQKKQLRDGEVMSYRSMGFAKIFLAMEDTEIMREYYGDVLEPLVEYDRHNGTDFTDFLTHYFSCGASVKQVADELFVHRNTVNYKISRIEEILSCDLSNFNTKVELLIGLKLRDML